jgi:hypothetical protein
MSFIRCLARKRVSYSKRQIGTYTGTPKDYNTSFPSIKTWGLVL